MSDARNTDEPNDLERSILQLLDEAPEVFRRSLFSEQFIASQLDEHVETIATALDSLEAAGLVRLTNTRTSFGRSAALT